MNQPTNEIEQYANDNGLDMETIIHEEQDIWAEELIDETERNES